MNSAIIFALLIIGSFQMITAQLGTSDVTPLLQNQAIVQKQIKCVLDQGPCDNIGKQIKTVLPEVVTNNCRKCTPAQAANARKVANFIQQKYPSVYATLRARYQG